MTPYQDDIAIKNVEYVEKAFNDIQRRTIHNYHPDHYTVINIGEVSMGMSISMTFWLYENTVGNITMSDMKIGFSDPKEATMFLLLWV